LEGSVHRAITLMRRESGEADRIGILLSRDGGKIPAVARGARRPKSRLAPLIEAFALAECVLIPGRGEFDILAGGEVLEPFRDIRADVARYARASLVCEIVEKGLEPREPMPRLFDLLEDALRRLAQGRDGDTIEFYFLIHALGLLGYSVALERCAACGAELPPGPVVCLPEAGGAVCDDCYPADRGRVLSAAARDSALRILRVRLGEALALPLDPECAAELLSLVRGHARYHLDVRLRSLTVLETTRDPGPPM